MAISLELEGAVVLVTGGTRGVGRGITQRFLAAGCHVVTCGRTEPDELPAAEGASASFHEADVRDAEQVEGLIDAVVAEHGRLDAVVNNAGGSPPAEAATASPRFSAAVIDLNLGAPLLVAQHANRVMQGQDGGGSIVNIASLSGLRASPGTAAYGAAKAGLINLTKSLAIEWAPKVRVNAVSAGIIRTEQAELHYGDEDAIGRIAATIPAGRMGEPSDVGDACLFLASRLASYVTGANLEVHGGGEVPAFQAAADAYGGDDEGSG